MNRVKAVKLARANVGHVLAEALESRTKTVANAAVSATSAH